MRDKGFNPKKKYWKEKEKPSAETLVAEAGKEELKFNGCLNCGYFECICKEVENGNTE